MRQVRDDFQQRLRKEPTPKQTLSRWDHKLFQTGSKRINQKLSDHNLEELNAKRLTTQLASLQKIWLLPQLQSLEIESNIWFQ